MLTCQKSLFQLPESVSYLNCSYLSPQLRSVETAGIAAVSGKNHPFALQINDFFKPVQRLKRLFAQVIQTADNERIAIIPSVSYGIATVARNLQLQAGDNIIVAEDQFPSNIYAWQRLTENARANLRIVHAPDSAQRTQAWNDAILQHIDNQTRMVAIGSVHWTDGTLFDLKAIRQKTREIGALLVIDGTQSVGALPINVSDLQPDALICAGYKWLLGPYAIGLAYYGPHFDNGVPIEENWINRLHSEDFKNLVSYQSAYQPGAARYAVGEQSNFILVPMLIAALEQLLQWNVAAIQDYTRQLSAQPVAQLIEMGAQAEIAADRCGHLFGIRIQERHFDFQKLQAELAERQVFVSFRGNAIRVSPYVYNEAKDFEQLIKSFEMARRPALTPVP